MIWQADTHGRRKRKKAHHLNGRQLKRQLRRNDIHKRINTDIMFISRKAAQQAAGGNCRVVLVILCSLCRIQAPYPKRNLLPCCLHD
jgi:hypothetical protein